ncbi:response regulator [Rhodococcus sp. CH91]|uniref:response regulator n=1 Tax=Rhodococcus sp. CH91 TaxID=2910256 RepID=UPI001F4B2E0A|nr:response regulator [Rhodococcus sp. CH91]
MTRVLVVDDEPQILRALRINLTARHYTVLTATTAATALHTAAREHPDIIILDLGLPDLDGMHVITGLRGWCTAPIIVLTARTDATDTITALDAGADDYITKPFGMGELLARIRAAERRTDTTTPTDPTIVTDDFTIDLAARKVTRDGTTVHLTPTEWAMLAMLARHHGKLVGQRELLTELWGPTYTGHTHYLRVYLAQLRHKLEPDPTHPRHLITEPGQGYRFEI